jgi:hypothetical protein
MKTLAFLLLIGAAIACGDRVAQTTSGIAVSWTFDPVPKERAYIHSVLTKLRSDSSFIDGELSRLPTLADSGRYLLVRSLDTPAGREIAFYVIGAAAASAGITAPYLTGVLDHPYEFEPLLIIDTDQDGATDFAFCVWPQPERRPTRRVLGYRHGKWYEIDRLAISLPECPAQGAP